MESRNVCNCVYNYYRVITLIPFWSGDDISS